MVNKDNGNKFSNLPSYFFYLVERFIKIGKKLIELYKNYKRLEFQT
jgi:hypothetical protein